MAINILKNPKQQSTSGFSLLSRPSGFVRLCRICVLSFNIAIAYLYNYRDWQHFLPMDYITSITADPFNVYIGMPKGIMVLNKIDNRLVRTNTSVDLSVLKDKSIKFFGYDKELGLLWIILEPPELVGFNPHTRAHFSIRLDFSPHTFGIGKTYLYFIDSEAKSFRMHKKKRRFEEFAKIDTNAIYYGRESSYKPTDYSFLLPFYYTDENFKTYPISLVFPDRNRLWVGTSGYGVLVYDLSSKLKLAHLRFGLGKERITRIKRFDADLWLFSQKQYIKTTPSFESWEYYDLLPHSKIMTGAFQVRPFLKLPILELQRVNEVLLLSGDTSQLFIAAENKLYHYDFKADILSHLTTFPYWIEDILAENDKVFLATGFGLFIYDLLRDTIEEIIDPFASFKFGVRSIARTNKNNYFSVSGGIVRMEGRNWYHLIPPGADLSRQFILYGFGDYLFIGTNRGLIIYEENKERYTYLTEREGLLSNDIQDLSADSTYLYILTPLGLSRFAYKKALR